MIKEEGSRREKGKKEKRVKREEKGQITARAFSALETHLSDNYARHKRGSLNPRDFKRVERGPSLLCSTLSKFLRVQLCSPDLGLLEEIRVRSLDPFSARRYSILQS